jgi:hypothetical protein
VNEPGEGRTVQDRVNPVRLRCPRTRLPFFNDKAKHRMDGAGSLLTRHGPALTADASHPILSRPGEG